MYQRKLVHIERENPKTKIDFKKNEIFNRNYGFFR